MATTVSGNLITRSYRDFRGVDFSNRPDEVTLYHSPDALNVWKNYKNTNGKAIETRPDIELLKEFSETIYGLFFYTYNGKEYRIVHAGTNLYKDDDIAQATAYRNEFEVGLQDLDYNLENQESIKEVY